MTSVSGTSTDGDEDATPTILTVVADMGWNVDEFNLDGLEETEDGEIENPIDFKDTLYFKGTRDEEHQIHDSDFLLTAGVRRYYDLLSAPGVTEAINKPVYHPSVYEQNGSFPAMPYWPDVGQSIYKLKPDAIPTDIEYLAPTLKRSGKYSDLAVEKENQPDGNIESSNEYREGSSGDVASNKALHDTIYVNRLTPVPPSSAKTLEQKSGRTRRSASRFGSQSNPTQRPSTARQRISTKSRQKRPQTARSGRRRPTQTSAHDSTTSKQGGFSCTTSSTRLGKSTRKTQGQGKRARTGQRPFTARSGVRKVSPHRRSDNRPHSARWMEGKEAQHARVNFKGDRNVFNIDPEPGKKSQDKEEANIKLETADKLATKLHADGLIEELTIEDVRGILAGSITFEDSSQIKRKKRKRRILGTAIMTDLEGRPIFTDEQALYILNKRIKKLCKAGVPRKAIHKPPAMVGTCRFGFAQRQCNRSADEHVGEALFRPGPGSYDPDLGLAQSRLRQNQFRQFSGYSSRGPRANSKDQAESMSIRDAWSFLAPGCYNPKHYELHKPGPFLQWNGRPTSIHRESYYEKYLKTNSRLGPGSYVQYTDLEVKSRNAKLGVLDGHNFTFSRTKTGRYDPVEKAFTNIKFHLHEAVQQKAYTYSSFDLANDMKYRANYGKFTPVNYSDYVSNQAARKYDSVESYTAGTKSTGGTRYRQQRDKRMEKMKRELALGNHIRYLRQSRAEENDGPKFSFGREKRFYEMSLRERIAIKNKHEAKWKQHSVDVHSKQDWLMKLHFGDDVVAENPYVARARRQKEKEKIKKGKRRELLRAKKSLTLKKKNLMELDETDEDAEEQVEIELKQVSNQIKGLDESSGEESDFGEEYDNIQKYNFSSFTKEGKRASLEQRKLKRKENLTKVEAHKKDRMQELEVKRAETIAQGNYRMAEVQRRELRAIRRDIQTVWLFMIALFSRAHHLHRTLAGKKAILKLGNLRQRTIERVLEASRRWKRQVRARKKLRAVLRIQKAARRFLFVTRQLRRRKAMDVIMTTLIANSAHNRIHFFVRNFHFKVKRLQRWWRRMRPVCHARRRFLSMLFTRCIEENLNRLIRLRKERPSRTSRSAPLANAYSQNASNTRNKLAFDTVEEQGLEEGEEGDMEEMKGPQMVMGPDGEMISLQEHQRLMDAAVAAGLVDAKSANFILQTQADASGSTIQLHSLYYTGEDELNEETDQFGNNAHVARSLGNQGARQFKRTGESKASKIERDMIKQIGLTRAIKRYLLRKNYIAIQKEIVSMMFRRRVMGRAETLQQMAFKKSQFKHHYTLKKGLVVQLRTQWFHFVSLNDCYKWISGYMKNPPRTLSSKTYQRHQAGSPPSRKAWTFSHRSSQYSSSSSSSSTPVELQGLSSKPTYRKFRPPSLDMDITDSDVGSNVTTPSRSRHSPRGV